jgi:hypothetical protein
MQGLPGVREVDADNDETDVLQGSFIDLTTSNFAPMPKSAKGLGPRYPLNAEEEKKYKAPNPIPLEIVETEAEKERERTREQELKKLMKMAKAEKLRIDVARKIAEGEKRLLAIKNELKGKEYAFDEKGNVMLVKALTTDNMPSYIPSAAFRVKNAPVIENKKGKKGGNKKLDGEATADGFNAYHSLSSTIASNLPPSMSDKSNSNNTNAAPGTANSTNSKRGSTSVPAVKKEEKVHKDTALAQPPLSLHFVPIEGVVLRVGPNSKAHKKSSSEAGGGGGIADLSSKKLNRAQYMAILEAQRDQVLKDADPQSQLQSDAGKNKSVVTGTGTGLGTGVAADKGSKSGTPDTKSAAGDNTQPSTSKQQQQDKSSSLLAADAKSSSTDDAFPEDSEYAIKQMIPPSNGQVISPRSKALKANSHANNIGSGVSRRSPSRNKVDSLAGSSGMFRPPSAGDGSGFGVVSPRQIESPDDLPQYMESSRSEKKLKEVLRNTRVRKNDTAGASNYKIRGNGILTPTTSAIVHAALSASQRLPPDTPGSPLVSHRNMVVSAVKDAAAHAHALKLQEALKQQDFEEELARKRKAASPLKQKPFSSTSKDVIETTTLHQFYFKERVRAGTPGEEDFMKSIGESMPSSGAGGGAVTSFSGNNIVK